MSDIKTKVDESFNMYNSQFEDLEDAVGSSLEYIKDIDPCIGLGNIGSDASKVIKIIYDYYKEKGVNPITSLSFEMVINYIYYIAMDAKDLLLDYIDEFVPDNMFTGQLRERRKQRDNDLNISCLEEYRFAEDQILCFDLDRDIVSIIDEYLEESDLPNNKINKWVDLYNSELDRLEISNRIEYRNLEDVKVKQKID